MQYKYDFIGGLNNSYVFETYKGIIYEIKFKPSTYINLFSKEVSEFIFEFVIKVAVNETGKNPTLDKLVSETIAEIFKEFLLKHKNNIALYICDSSDVRQEARRRKFNQWVDLFKGDEFLKFDTAIKENLKITYHSSLIIRDDNPYKMQIIEAFINLGKDQDK